MAAHGELAIDDAPEAVKFTFQLFAGSSAAVIAKTAVAPLDRVKILFQVQHVSLSPASHRFAHLREALRRLPALEGPSTLWRGNGINVLRAVPSAAIKFVLFERTRDLLAHVSGVTPAQFSHRLIAGAISGSTSLVLLYPLDVARTLAAADWKAPGSPRLYGSVLRWLGRSVQKDGLFSLFPGIGLSILGIVPYQALAFTVYDTLKHNLPDQGASGRYTAPKLAAGTMAAVVAQTVTYPLDTVRRRLQVNGRPGYQRVYEGTVDAIVTILRQEGPMALYRGVGINALRSVPGTAMQFVLYDHIKELLLPSDSGSR